MTFKLLLHLLLIVNVFELAMSRLTNSSAKYDHLISGVCKTKVTEVRHICDISSHLNLDKQKTYQTLLQIKHIKHQRRSKREIDLQQMDFPFLKDLKQLLNKESVIYIVPKATSSIVMKNIRMETASFSVIFEEELMELTLSKLKLISQGVSIILCPFQLKILERFLLKENRFLDPSLIWVVNNSEKSTFKKVNIPINSNFFTYHSSKDDLVFNEVYRKSRSSENILTSWNYWTNGNGFISKENNKLDRRSDLSGVIIKAGTKENPPFVYAKEVKLSETLQIPGKIPTSAALSIDGFLGDVWNHLQSSMNFSTVFWDSEDGLWSGNFPNGSWKGLYGLIEQEKVDIIVNDNSLKLSRAKDFDHTSIIVISVVRMFIPTPGASSELDWFMFFKPFSWDMWISIVTTICLVPFLWYLMHRCIEDTNEGGLSDCFYSAFALFCQQGSEYEPSKLSLRIVLLIFATFSLVVVESFGATLTSIFAVVKLSLPFQDLNGLYYNSDFKIATLKGTSTDSTFRDGNDVQRKVYNERYLNIDSLQEAYDYLKTKPKYAFAYDSNAMAAEFGHLCDVMEIRSHVIREAKYVFYARKDYEYLDLINYHLAKMRQNGFIGKMWLKWKPKFRQDCLSNSTNQIMIEQIISAFCLLFIALVISCLIMLCEMIISKRKYNMSV